MEKEENNLAIILVAVSVLMVLSIVYHFKSEMRYLENASRKIFEARSVRITFTGDIMLDRIVRKNIDASGLTSIIGEVKQNFDNQDAVVGNLEGVVTDSPSISLQDFNRLKFTFATSTVPELKKIGFTGFNLANNHTLDFGSEGYSQTENNLRKNNLFYFGSPLNDKNLSTEIAIKGENICFVGFHSLYNPSDNAVINELKQIKPKCTFIIVFAHWGVEYQDKETPVQRIYAHDFIDAGADLVVGAHPHVIEPMEIYKDRAIFYSLGNFIFDQTFSLSTRQGLVVSLELTKDAAKYKLKGVQMDNFKLHNIDTANFSNIISKNFPLTLPRQ